MKARILVVDDDAALSEMIGIILASEDFEPVYCYDGAGARDVFRARGKIACSSCSAVSTPST